MPTIRIRELRKKKRVPQRELGILMGVGQSTVSAWERGLRSPEVDQLQKLSEFFEVSVDYLLGFDSGYGGLPEENASQGGSVSSSGSTESRSIESNLPDSDLSPEGILELCRFYEYVKKAYPARR